MKIYKLKYAAKAPQLSQDALTFADEVYSFLLQNGFKNGFHRIVKNDGTKKDIWITPQDRKTTRNTGRGSSNASTNWGNIFILNDLNLKDKNNIIDFLRHELIHCFSVRAEPKFEDKTWNSPMTKTDNPQENSQYYLMPDEQDAYMYEKAQRLIRLLIQQNKDSSSLKNAISQLKPSDEIEKIWYHNGEAWKKFLNTIYQMLPR